jgi:two-component system sensor histidine kinase PilS (NtrC family)
MAISEQTIPAPFRAAGEATRALAPDASRRVVRLVAVFRVLVGLALLAVSLVSRDAPLLNERLPAEFRSTAALYALLAVGILVYQRRQPIAGPLRVPALLSLDIAAIVMLMHTGAGIRSGIGGLLVVFVGAAALTLPGRHAFLAAAIATMAVLLEQALAFSQRLAPVNDFIAAGMLGAVIFAIAAAAFPLARRLEESEALAHQRGIDLANMAQLNEYIIRNLRESIVVVDAANNVRLMNQTAAEQLGVRSQANGQPLRRVSPELARLLEGWRRGEDSRRQLPTFVSADGSTQVNSYLAPLEGREDGPVLIFLEDAGLLAEKVQQSKLAALGRLTASIAHEVRNPVGAMSHAGQLLEESPAIGPTSTACCRSSAPIRAASATSSTTSCSSRAARPASRSCCRCAAGPAPSSPSSPPPWNSSRARWPPSPARTSKCAWTRGTCTRCCGTCARTR